MKPRWVLRRDILVRVDVRITWVIYSLGTSWVARTVPSMRCYKRFATRREAKIWVQRQERLERQEGNARWNT